MLHTVATRVRCAAFAEEKTVSAECAQKMCEAVVQVPRYLGVPKHGTGRSTSEAESRGEEECEEEDEDADEFRAPIELLAEVRHLYTHHLCIYQYTLEKAAEDVCCVVCVRM